MTKRDLLDLIANLGDDDEIIILKDGGEYWGSYYDELEVNFTVGPQSTGHPGGNRGRMVDCNKVAIIS
jgi:hypothetical protein